MNDGLSPPGQTGGSQLLVSVRSVAEARAAIDSGADIIDVKEPRRGSLGMADPNVIAAIAESVRNRAPAIPISAALGELADFELPTGLLPLPFQLRFAKLGLAGAARTADWPARWEAVRRSVDNSLNWVGVAYADWQSVAAPSPGDVINVAADAGCAGVLIDTCRKDSGRLVDLASTDQLTAWAMRIHECGMFTALAGRIAAADLPVLADVPNDVIAVRSAVCPAHQRNGEVSGELVASLRAQLHDACRASAKQVQAMSNPTISCANQQGRDDLNAVRRRRHPAGPGVLPTSEAQ